MSNTAHSESVHLCAELKIDKSVVLTVMSGLENSQNSNSTVLMFNNDDDVKMIMR